jgi:exopolysaccharide biosynthesis predicted pyruvyltransferase EpsI
MNLPEPLAKRFDYLEQSLRKRTRGKTIYYVANPGNWGDGLIRAGTLKFFAERGFSVIEQPYKSFRRRLWARPSAWLKAVERDRSVLLFGGGGAWCDLWDVSAYVKRIAPHFSATVVLPSTLQRDCRAIPATFFCRDDGPSLERNPQATFCDDMAFCLGMQPGGRDAVQEAGFFFRTDKESAALERVPAQNRDLSTEGSHMSEPAAFFAALGEYAVIHTDRLHVAIAAALLRRTVHLYEGRYFKNEAVFNASLAQNFPSVQFHAASFSG